MAQTGSVNGWKRSQKIKYSIVIEKYTLKNSIKTVKFKLKCFTITKNKNQES